jgi:hypothetical protein
MATNSGTMRGRAHWCWTKSTRHDDEWEHYANDGDTNAEASESRVCLRLWFLNWIHRESVSAPTDASVKLDSNDGHRLCWDNSLDSIPAEAYLSISPVVLKHFTSEAPLTRENTLSPLFLLSKYMSWYVWCFIQFILFLYILFSSFLFKIKVSQY